MNEVFSNLSYGTNDGQRTYETGDFVGGNVPYFNVDGIFGYMPQNGQIYQVNYASDRERFRPQKNHKLVGPVPRIVPYSAPSNTPAKSNSFEPVSLSNDAKKSLLGVIQE